MFGIGTPELLIIGIVTAVVLLPRVQRAWQEFWLDRRPVNGRPRFALKDMFACTALIAVGLAWIYVAYPMLRHSIDHLEFPVWLFIVGGAFIGSGILAPFKLASIGAVLGALVLLLLIYTAHSTGWPRF
jgi:hypothetical protein